MRLRHLEARCSLAGARSPESSHASSRRSAASAHRPGAGRRPRAVHGRTGVRRRAGSTRGRPRLPVPRARGRRRARRRRTRRPWPPSQLAAHFATAPASLSLANTIACWRRRDDAIAGPSASSAATRGRRTTRASGTRTCARGPVRGSPARSAASIAIVPLPHIGSSSGRPGPPSGERQQARREILAQRRLLGVAALAALEQRLARGVEVDRGGRRSVR